MNEQQEAEFKAWAESVWGKRSTWIDEYGSYGSDEVHGAYVAWSHLVEHPALAGLPVIDPDFLGEERSS